MQPMQLLHNMLINKIPTVNKARLKSLIASTSTLVSCKKLTLTSLGRNMNNLSKTRSNIRKVDRLLGNQNLQAELKNYYKSLNELIIPSDILFQINIDWSCLSSINKLYVLRACIPIKGRGIVVYEESHPKTNENNHEAHIRFLKNLKKVLPKASKPVLVTDAGFRAKWFAQVTKMGWDYVGRIRNNNLVKLSENKQWCNSKKLYKKASGKPVFLGNGLLTKNIKFTANFIIYKGKPKNRTRLNQSKVRSTSSKNKRYSKSYSEPWLLVTSLNQYVKQPHNIINIYKRRMQIEENFRDTKDRRYGFGLNESGSKTPQRMNILLLIAALASFACWIAGIVTRKSNNAVDFQAHSSKFVNALSIVYLGCEALRKNLIISNKDFWGAITDIRDKNFYIMSGYP